MKRFLKVHVSLGFTLIELMIAMGVLVVIAAIAIPAYTGYITAARRGECNNEIAAIKLAEEEFFLANNRYFSGVGVDPMNAGSLTNQSTGLYNPSPEALDAANTNCTYRVDPGSTGNIATSYSITATGANNLAAEGIIAQTGN